MGGYKLNTPDTMVEIGPYSRVWNNGSQ